MTKDKYFNLVKVKWLVNDVPDLSHPNGRFQIIATRDADGVRLFKETQFLLYIPNDQWEELKKIL